MYDDSPASVTRAVGNTRHRGDAASRKAGAAAGGHGEGIQGGGVEAVLPSERWYERVRLDKNPHE